MAFDYGSIDLGLKNPFKTEGKVTAIRGGVQAMAGLALLISAAATVKDDAGAGWILMAFGLVMLATGITVITGGTYAILRYFVGRNHPTSLAPNFSRSEKSTAREEAATVAYNAKQLEEMLIGRKNATFSEPQGFLARLLHTLMPKLLFMPYPVRNFAQRIFGAWTSTLVALVAYGLVAFVSLAGFAGAAGELLFPVYSVLLMVYLLLIWRRAGKPINREAERNIEALGGGALSRTITQALILPVLAGLLASWILNRSEITPAELDAFMAQIPNLNPGFYIAAVLLLGAAASALALVLLRQRLAATDPVAEVSELRENWQESVHPNEIFINLDNLVMANRRYKEVPNRVYRELDPQLQEQTDGKGGFRGEMIQEVQPRVKTMDLGETFAKARLAALLGGNLLSMIALAFTVMLAYQSVDIYNFIASPASGSLQQIVDSEQIITLLGLCMSALHILLVGFLLKSFGQLLSNAAHLHYAEIQFESLLVYFKCEGTFTESRISTGTGIHDSTRSENTLVRSSITPWVVVSRIVSTTFASTGMKNLEHPRHILEMHRDDQELQNIKEDVVGFLKDRESIASITSSRDLGNASQIHQLNQQTRAIPTQQGLDQDGEQAGYLRREEEISLPEPEKDK
ncbi:YgaP family membrane protein [Microbulbifer celer]|uniref:DUF2892 domain-containing protein n=1 Tax=Microbulbifer celer TaxID=435905 RepID=A0ABW3U5T9_9GAMM|nr:DUF2892 domain-containing protein [Microbulbifer celer]UFN56656.1 DUF2892 domain-containing protein [Microbulbifer celer]